MAKTNKQKQTNKQKNKLLNVLLSFLCGLLSFLCIRYMGPMVNSNGNQKQPSYIHMFLLFIGKSPTYKPSSCQLSKMNMGVCMSNHASQFL